eukprot:TRINITY_DN2722_c0_g1_i1.p1 TRINITY_DN2722_c0_g1~~TRINITY_DN2722_c0_g1_i1.p1  ORF type:complete len:667 (-),score=255.52 TRINITY_DN2722_c0_g1_i1:53-2053(-)
MMDPNEYVAEEDDELNPTKSYTVRTSCRRMIDTLLDVFAKEQFGALALMAAVQLRLGEMEEMKERGGDMWWKMREAIIHIMGSTAEALSCLPDESFSTDSFMQQLADDARSPASPFLRGRALSCASQFAAMCSEEASSHFLKAAIESLHREDEPFPVRIGACRAISTFCPNLKKELMGEYVPEILSGMCGLMRETHEDTLHLVVDTLLTAMEVDEAITARFHAPLTQHALEIWETFHNDHIVNNCVLDIFRVLGKIEGCQGELQEALVPRIVKIFNLSISGKIRGEEEADGGEGGEDDDLSALACGVVDAATELLHTLLLSSAEEVPWEGFARATFPVLVELLMTTHDTSVIDTGVKCAAAAVRRFPPALVMSFEHEGQPMVLLLARHLLTADIPDISLYKVGSLLSAMFEGELGLGGDALNETLVLALQRLHAAKFSDMQQTLVVFLAKLVLMNPDACVSVLAETTLEGGVGAAEFVLGGWLRWHMEFCGVFSRKVSFMALARLLQMNDERLASVVFRNEDGEQCPWAFRAVQILLYEYAKVAENAPGQFEFGADDSDEYAFADDFDDAEFARQYSIEGDEVGGRDGESPFMSADALSFQELMELAGNGDEDDDASTHPLYPVDAKEFLTEMFCSARDDPHMLFLAERLAEEDQELLQGIWSGAQ